MEAITKRENKQHTIAVTGAVTAGLSITGVAAGLLVGLGCCVTSVSMRRTISASVITASPFLALASVGVGLVVGEAIWPEIGYPGKDG